MDPQHPDAARRPLAAVSAVLALIAMLLVVQMWLLTATLEGYLAGYADVVLPGAIVSIVLLLGVIALYLFLERADRR